jgi:hypothetical protein
MSSIGILGAENYAASFMTQITLDQQNSLAGLITDGVSLSSKNENFAAESQLLIDASDILIADGADLRYYPWILKALRCGRFVYLLNPLSVSFSFFDEAHKTATEAETCLIPALPFNLSLCFSEMKDSMLSFTYVDYVKTERGALNQNIIRNAIFFMMMLCRSHIRNFSFFLPPQQEQKERYVRFFLKFENGFGAAIELISSFLDEKQGDRLKIVYEQSVQTIELEPFHYSISGIPTFCVKDQSSQNEQLCCTIAWYLTWFEKKVKPLL